ncbi:MAG: PD-(D/E)XK nuclease family protein [Campylobacterales bacterium]|nr:PD-(D/E)XK nuclease family protein [Campylobacterales bacterium]
MIHIFPTNRAIRSFYATFASQDTLLPKAMSIAEFFKKALVVEGKVQAEEEMRLLLMQQAVAFDAFEALNIPQHFMAFVKNASYLFRFFEELSAEEKGIEALEGADVYAQFSEHLALLAKVRENYVSALEARGLYDAITLPACAHVDETFILTCKEITVHLEGYLSGFEWRVFEEIARLIPLHVELIATPYNHKVLRYVQDKGVKITQGDVAQVTLGSWTSRVVASAPSLPPVSVSPVDSRSLQVGFVFDSIARFMQAGLKPEEIAVVLPDESFVPLLRLYDHEYALNYAMGNPFEDLFFVVRLHALRQAISQSNQESKHRIARLGIDTVVLEAWKTGWKKQVDFPTFVSMVGSFEEESTQVKEQLHEALGCMERVLSAAPSLHFAEVLTLFLRHLEGLRVDDVTGGPVTVMGVLETRGVAYRGVIVPDFNDDLVPRRSEKDLFLSSLVRHHAGLPDKEDREQLQRYYYMRLFSNASCVAISYVANEEKLPSRFLHALNATEEMYDAHLGRLLMPYVPARVRNEEEIEAKHDPFAKPLSATRLKTLLTCKRRYYYRYVQRIEEPTLPVDMLEPMEVGKALHVSLEKACAHGQFGVSEAVNAKIVTQAVEEAFGKSTLWRLEKEVWKERLKSFCANEAERYLVGWRPWKLEERLETTFAGVRLEGAIDRIDRHVDGELEVLDYKTGTTLKSGPKSTQNMVDFQMQFYFLLASTLGEVVRVGYYDVLQGVCVEEEKMEEKLAQLVAILETYRHLNTFEKTEKLAHCTYCPYVHLCGRG